jgi:5-methylcytosine-specific restriction endonuclease McrA
MSKNRGKENKFSKTQKRKLIKNQHGKCFMCAGCKNLEPHHIIPVSEGGETTIKNGIAVCRPCHVEIHRHKLTIYYSMIEKLMMENKPKTETERRPQ